ncbi:hypothetical protein AHMF7605_15025 [Adhaeribacter arboris]|uniref:Beta-lactamase-related domain-containing protein n=1 Tax=Adhaeribacter arboris TaxID=2072846 RepID=A0A2T2YGT9_9BACT|nr:serine hydrolase domain-containing protein [Adhaeribacter arboris]PSR54725.1 hypothetical protein AHMF7605_15025 [Adhaeribacter arboris]
MKSVKILLLAFTIFSFSSCEKEAFEQAISKAVYSQPFKTDHSKAAAIQAIIDEYTRKGLPGIVVAIKDAEGVWEGTSGYAQIESNTKLTPGFVHAGASLTKMYAATAVMQLYEQHLIDLDKSITQYLPATITSKITQSEAITVRMLLNHTSGIPDYLENNDNFKLKWFNNLAKGWTTEEALAEAYHKPFLFVPGTQFSYANINYVLLSLLIEHVTGQREGDYLKEHILNKLNLQHTFYKVQPDYLSKLAMPNYYLDRYGDGRLQNATSIAKAEIRSELGDGGLVATGIDFVTFMDALANGRIVSQQSLAAMKTFNQGEYGLGLQNGFNYKNKFQYGHIGSVLGGAAMMLYFEEQKTALYVGSNVDVSFEVGKSLFLYHEMKNKVSEYIASME